ncbi:MAG: DUF1318 domain-containing protein [Gammaproteobacteria bacterium]|nr:MAG: DUF1318 domain-containing protein [Gammaproteobacteria bacterium]
MNTKVLLSILLSAFLALATNVIAADIKSAKAAGYIGEQLDGYIGLVDPKAPDDVKALVKDVNQKRRAIYQKLAQKQNLPLAEIEKVAGKRNIERTPPGQYVQSPNGNWVRKK